MSDTIDRGLAHLERCSDVSTKRVSPSTESSRDRLEEGRGCGRRAGSPLRFVLLLSIFPFLGNLGACESVQQRVAEHEDKLSAAGFIVKPANTPARQEMLKKLPPNQFVRCENGDTIHYVYADQIVCGCLYVGTQEAYNRFKANELAQHLADEEQLTAHTYFDASWNWGAWGPWGRYRFSYGPGW